MKTIVVVVNVVVVVVHAVAVVVVVVVEKGVCHSVEVQKLFHDVQHILR